jgi:hypothetical protein
MVHAVGHGLLNTLSRSWLKGYYENYSKYFPYSNQEKYDAHNMYVTALDRSGDAWVHPPSCGIFISFVCVERMFARMIKNCTHPELKDMAGYCISSIYPLC